MVEIKEFSSPKNQATAKAEESDIETLQNPEELHGRSKRIIGFIGESWSGSSGVAKEVARRLRKKYENGNELVKRRYGLELGPIEREIEIDMRVDGWQKKFLRKATEDYDNPVFEMRLFAVNLAEERDIRDEEITKREKERKWKMQKGKQPRPRLRPIPAISVLVIANQKTRVNRAFNAQLEAYERQQQEILDGKRISQEDMLERPTKEEIKKRMDERKETDLDNWAQVHPDYLSNKRDPFDPSIERHDGSPVYDIVVTNPDKDGVSYEEAMRRCANYVLEELDKFGAFESLSFAELDAIARNTKQKTETVKLATSLPESGEIFDSKNIGEKDADKIGKKIKTNGKNQPKGSFGGKSKTETRSGKSFGEPVSRRNFPN